ncbi:MAG: hypothetical protein OXB89_07555, partial [Anaerolineaceae bacterium]|nr:hypothetical protein [Anaerolineaceae bacterium]
EPAAPMANEVDQDGALQGEAGPEQDPGDRSASAPGPAATPDSVDSRLLTVRLARSDDARRDRRRLERIVNTISSWPGEDSFCIVVDSGEQALQLDFETGVGVCEEMIDTLQGIVGAENLSLEQTDTTAGRRD